LEHITTKEAVDFVLAQGPLVAATITAHHLLYNRNALFEGGLRPHMYCLPVLKHETDRQALLRAIKTGSSKFFMGTDSAPHTTLAKHCAQCCAGVYTAHAALEFYATVRAATWWPIILCLVTCDWMHPRQPVCAMPPRAREQPAAQHLYMPAHGD